MDSSPAQRLLGRCTKTQLPITAELLKPQHVNTDDINNRIKTHQQKQANYYNRKARDLPPLQKGDVVRMRPFTMNGKTWDMATVAKRLDERSHLVATEDVSYRQNEWNFKRHKKGVNQIPVASKDVKSTQEMAVRNPNPYASRPLCHLITTTNLVPLK